MRYRWKTGMLAWVLFRVTGLALVGYLAMHIMVISNLHDRDKFDETMRFLGSWQFRVLELGLFFVVLYHALNGIRVMIVDFFDGSIHQAKLFWIMASLGVVLFIAGAYPMLSHALYWKDVQTGKRTHEAVGYGAPKESKRSADGQDGDIRKSDRKKSSERARKSSESRSSKRARRSSDNRVNAPSMNSMETNPPPSSYTPGLAPMPGDTRSADQIKPVEPIEPIKPKGGK